MDSNESRPFAGSAIFTEFQQKDPNEESFSQPLSQNFYLVLGRHDHHQWRVLCRVPAYPANADETIVARSRSGWTKRAKGRRVVRAGGRRWVDCDAPGNREILRRHCDFL